MTKHSQISTDGLANWEEHLDNAASNTADIIMNELHHLEQQFNYPYWQKVVFNKIWRHMEYESGTTTIAFAAARPDD
jgi:hypothetical protein